MDRCKLSMSALKNLQCVKDTRLLHNILKFSATKNTVMTMPEISKFIGIYPIAYLLVLSIIGYISV